MFSNLQTTKSVVREITPSAAEEVHTIQVEDPSTFNKAQTNYSFATWILAAHFHKLYWGSVWESVWFMLQVYSHDWLLLTAQNFRGL